MNVQVEYVKDPTVSDQYDSEEAAQFYQVVMGDGGGDIHYGIYESPTDSALKASENTVLEIYKLAESAGVQFNSSTKVLDSGSGNGGSAHKVSQKAGAHVTCLNICEGQNKENIRQSSELGIEDKIDVVTGSFDKLPSDWTARFDVIWSQDAFVHSNNKKNVLYEAFRCLKPGGHIVFTDIMASELCSADDLDYFKKRMHVQEVFTPTQYKKELSNTGFNLLDTKDFSGHLIMNYQRMIERAQSERRRLHKCSDDYLGRYTTNLRKNIEILTQREAQVWVAMVAQKL